MADIANKYAENVSGEFYVDDQCIDCDLCRETAPANFRRSDDGGYSYVFKQPTTPEEEALSKEAMEGCPVEATIWSNSWKGATTPIQEGGDTDGFTPSPYANGHTNNGWLFGTQVEWFF